MCTGEEQDEFRDLNNGAGADIVGGSCMTAASKARLACLTRAAAMERVTAGECEGKLWKTSYKKMFLR